MNTNRPVYPAACSDGARAAAAGGAGGVPDGAAGGAGGAGEVPGGAGGTAPRACRGVAAPASSRTLLHRPLPRRPQPPSVRTWKYILQDKESTKTQRIFSNSEK